MKKNKYFIFVFIFICCSFILLTIDNACSQKEKPVRKISIKLDYIPQTDKSTILNNITLSKLLPALNGPRLFSYDDIEDEYEKNVFKDGGYYFVIQGNFENDGSTYIAFIVKDKSWAKKKNVYMVIVSIKGNTVTRDYFCDLQNDRAYLRFYPRYKPGINAIFVAYDIIGSDACGFVYWNGQKYITDTCGELNNYYEGLENIK